jgi:hypothetical protein
VGTVVYTRAPTGPGRLQIFVGDFGVRAARPIGFTLDGRATAPTVLRPLGSVRGPQHGAKPGEERAFVGVYEFRNLEPGRLYRVGVRLGELERRLDARVVPDRVAPEEEGGFDVLLSSCFYRDERSLGQVQRALRQLLASVRPKRRGGRSPDLALLMGDQVYLDLPTFEDLPDDMPKLARRFEGKYQVNWEGYLPELLGAAPAACLPDDHEFWNNAPHVSPQIGNSYTAAGRRRWREAATLCYQAFAQPHVDPNLALVAPPRNAPADVDAVDQPLVIDVHPLSFFLADGRSRRDEGRAFAFTPACRAALRAWIARINAAGRIGIFVSGQSLLREPASHVGGSVADWEMPNYGDYEEVLGELGRAQKRMLWLTGDVHWGRVCSLKNRFNEPRVQEVVVSPLSLVTTVGADQAKLAWNWVKGLVNRDNPWPRHSEAESPPAELRLGSTASARHRAGIDPREGGKPAQIIGNQLGLLSFDWTRGQLRATVTYFPVHEKITAPVRVPLFTTSIA